MVQKEDVMIRVVVHCPCGHVMRDTDEDRLIVQAQRHAVETHGMELTRQQVLAMMRPE